MYSFLKKLPEKLQLIWCLKFEQMENHVPYDAKNIFCLKHFCEYFK